MSQLEQQFVDNLLQYNEIDLGILFDVNGAFLVGDEVVKNIGNE